MAIFDWTIVNGGLAVVNGFSRSSDSHRLRIAGGRRLLVELPDGDQKLGRR